MGTTIHRIFSWLRRHPGTTWAMLFVYAAVVTFPHEQVQTFVGSLIKWLGRATVYRIAGATGLALGALASAGFIPELRRQTHRGLMIAYWVITLLLIFATWSVLTANNTELVHYPQYFVPGAMLMALTLSPIESLAWITITGALDECYQYWGLHGTWGIPFDFNDVFMDFLGGALGVVFALAFLRCQTPLQRISLKQIISRPATALLLAIAASGAILFASGKMLLYSDPENHSYWFALSRKHLHSFWFFDETWGPKTFHTLSPIEGPIVLILGLSFYGLLERRLNISAPDALP